MKVKATQRFKGKEENRFFEENDEFTTTKERGKQLIDLKLVTEVKEAPAKEEKKDEPAKEEAKASEALANDEQPENKTEKAPAKTKGKGKKK